MNATAPLPVPLPPDDDPKDYRIEEELKPAVEMAALLGRPLLVTGDPGTGKTHLARFLAAHHGMAGPFVFETKSTSQASDLFYQYDAIGHYHARQCNNSTEALDYIRFQALGRAILEAKPREEIDTLLPAISKPDHQGPQRSVVLIDEIDKAPRDFPNDILNEIDEFYFRVPELDLEQAEKITAPREMLPLVIITSNQEKDLPDPFLRRCCFFHIPFPRRERLAEIVEARLKFNPEKTDCQRALDFFLTLRDPQKGLRRRPATAELLLWLRTLQHHAGEEATTPCARLSDTLLESLSILAKTKDDLNKAHKLATLWLNKT